MNWESSNKYIYKWCHGHFKTTQRKGWSNSFSETLSVSCLQWPSFLLLNLSTSLAVDHRWTGEDRSCRLEDQHPSEALHKWKQRGAVVLAGSGGLQWGEERTPPAVCHRLHQGPLTGVQSAAGWVMDWLKDHTNTYCAHISSYVHLIQTLSLLIHFICPPEVGYTRPMYKILTHLIYLTAIQRFIDGSFHDRLNCRLAFLLNLIIKPINQLSKYSNNKIIIFNTTPISKTLVRCVKH